MSVDIPFVSFLIENSRQHLPDTYLSLVNAPPPPFTIGFGPAVADKGHPAAAPPHTFPVRFL